MSICAVILTILLSGASQCPHVGVRRNPTIAFLIEEASRESAIFRWLVTAIERLGHELQDALATRGLS